jgi:hypothetical protein
MRLNTLIAALRAYNLLDLLRFARDVQTLIRVQFLYAAIDSGLLAALKTPATRTTWPRSLMPDARNCSKRS